MFILVAACVVVVGVGHIGGRLLGPLAVSQIEAQTGMKAQAESARFGPTGRLRLNNLRIMTDEENPSLVLQAQEVSARFRLLSLLRGSPEMKTLTVNGGLLNGEYDPARGRWNFASLVAKQQQGSVRVARLPQILITGSTALLSRREGDRSRSILSVPLGLEARSTAGGGYEFHMSGATSVHKVKSGTRSWIIDVRGRADRTGEFEVKAAVDNVILADKRADGEISVGREMAEVLHGDLVKLWDRYSPSGVVDMKVEMSGSLADIGKGHISSTFMFRDVSICYDRFPYLLEHVKGNIVFEDGDLTIDGLSGEHGQTRVTIEGESRGSGPTWESDVKIRSERAVIDGDVYEALTTAQQKIWFMFSPSGTAELDFHYQSSRGKEVLSRATLNVIDGEMMYVHFPHRFKKGRGTFVFEPDSVRIPDVNFCDGDSETRFEGEVTNILSGRPEIRISGASKGLPIESRLLSQSVRPQYSKQLSNLDFSGRMDVNLSVFSTRTAGWGIDYIADANVSVPALKYQSGAVSLEDVFARVRVAPMWILLKGMDGKYGDGTAHVRGRIELPEDANAPACYRLEVDGNDVVVDRGLLAFVPAKHKKLVNEMRPSGRINVSARLNSCQDAAVDSISVECLGNEIELGKTGYRLSNMTGKASINGRSMQFDDLRAIVLDPGGGEPGHASLAGKIRVGTDRLEEMNVSFEAEGLRFGKGLRGVMEKLAPRLYDTMAPIGQIDLKDNNITVSVDPNGQRVVQFRGQMNFRDCAFGRDEFSGIRARLNIEGVFEREMVLGDIKADLHAETLSIRDKLVTDLEGRVEYHKGEKTWSLGNFRGGCYDGHVTGDVVVSPEEDGKFTYLLKGRFEDVSMGKFLARPGSDPNTLSSGVMKGALMVKGQLGEKSSRTGTLAVSVGDMRIGRMSLMAKIFTLMSLSVPGDVAFRGMDMDSDIKGDRLLIRNLRMSGDALNFKGSGVIDLDRRLVDIDLAATSPAPSPGLLTSVMTGLRYAAVYLKVRGELDDPMVQITPLPVLDKAIEKVLGTRE